MSFSFWHLESRYKFAYQVWGLLLDRTALVQDDHCETSDLFRLFQVVIARSPPKTSGELLYLKEPFSQNGNLLTVQVPTVGAGAALPKDGGHGVEPVNGGAQISSISTVLERCSSSFGTLFKMCSIVLSVYL